MMVINWSLMLFDKVECCFAKLIFGGDGTPYCQTISMGKFFDVNIKKRSLKFQNLALERPWKVLEMFGLKKVYEPCATYGSCKGTVGECGLILGSLSTRVFETRTATGREHFMWQDSGVFKIFILILSNGEKILIKVNVVVWRQVKRENNPLPATIHVSKRRVLKLPNKL